MSEWPVVELDALPLGVVGREYIVGTYFNDGRASAYHIRNCSTEWVGFEEYRVLAPSFAEAKKAAIKDRKKREKGA